MISNERKAEIERIACATFPFERGIPAKKLETIIYKEGLWFSEIDSGKEFLGALVKVGEYPLHIYVNKAITPIGRKNFTIAHELGHFKLGHHLHSPVIYCKKIKENDEQVSQQEDEASYFARCYLMPKEKIEKEFTKWFKWRVSQYGKVFLLVEPRGKQWQLWKAVESNLTEHFVVSKRALKIRLAELGLINNFSHKDY